MAGPTLESEGGAARWTSPFCLLLCDTLRVRTNASGSALELADGECAGARAALARFGATPSTAVPLVDGRGVAPAEALDAAAGLLAASVQPLIGGLGTDVAGARAVYRLARETGAICDVAQGAALMHTVRTLQDRGGYGTTLAEVRNRADLIVCLGGMPGDGAAEFLSRCAVGAEGAPRRHLVLLGGSSADHAALAALAERLLAARYGVLVAQTSALPAHGGLIVETTQRIVATLNQSTRAAAMWLGGGNGAGTVNEVFTWLSALPMRTRVAGQDGAEHDPLCFDTDRLLADGAVDSLLWVSSFDPDGAPPSVQMPLIVLGHPELASSAQRQGSVFIPVSTPGIGSAGHLFRADGGAVLPLIPVYKDTLPTVADVVHGLLQRVQNLRAAQPKAHPT